MQQSRSLQLTDAVNCRLTNPAGEAPTSVPILGVTPYSMGSCAPSPRPPLALSCWSAAPYAVCALHHLGAVLNQCAMSITHKPLHQGDKRVAAVACWKPQASACTITLSLSQRICKEAVG